MGSYELDVTRNVLWTWCFFLVLFTILCALTIIAVRIRKYPLNMTEERCIVHLEKPGQYVLNPHKGSQIEMIKFQVPQQMKNFAETKNDGLRRRNVESSTSEIEIEAKNDDVTSNLEVIYRGLTFSNSDLSTNDEVTLSNFELRRVDSSESVIVIKKKNDGVSDDDNESISNLQSHSDIEVRNTVVESPSNIEVKNTVVESTSDIEVRNTVVESTSNIEVRLRKGEDDMESGVSIEFDHYIILERPGKYAISADPGYTLSTVKFQLPSDCRIWSSPVMSNNKEETNSNNIDIKRLKCHVTLFVPGKYVLNIQRGSEHGLIYITVPEEITITEDENYKIVRMNYDVKTCERSVKKWSRSVLIRTDSMGNKKDGRIRCISMRSRKIPSKGKLIKISARLLLR